MKCHTVAKNQVITSVFIISIKLKSGGSSDGKVVKNLPTNAGDTVMIPDLRPTYCRATNSMHHNY